ncbi:MAG TPA: type III-A CRISPR-associated RAMP protein Csm4 [Aquifex aeolicus]|nr:type III-A CRISPR-associated RAMP protein Csm4 [Aquifex aeolicus]
MIKAYRIKHLSPITRIRSFTLFGAFCWNYRFIHGKKKLQEFLEEFRQTPKFLISSPFPIVEEKPLFPAPSIKTENEKVNIIQKLKRKPFKKAKFTTLEVLKDLKNGEIKTYNDLVNKCSVRKGILVKSNEEVSELKQQQMLFLRNSLHRITMKSERLFTETASLLKESYFIVKFIDEKFLSEFEIILKLMEENGLGGNKNIGWGKIKIEEFNIDTKIFEGNGRRFITLSPVIPTENIDIERSLYELETFKSFTDATFSREIIKKKVFYLAEGSLIVKKENNKFAGILKNVGFSENIYQYGYEFPIFLEW